MQPDPRELARSPDRARWNARYRERPGPTFRPHPLAVRALSLPLPTGGVLDLASGPSGSALLAAGAGRRVTAVDVSEVALAMLGEEAAARGLADLITLVHADLATWRPRAGAYALVLCTGYWDLAVFGRAVGAVAGGGLLAWEAFTQLAHRARPALDARWCLGPGEPACLLPAAFTVLCQRDVAGPGEGEGEKRMLLARRQAPGGERHRAISR